MTFLDVTGLKGDVRCWASAKGPWGFEVQPGPRVYFHIIAEGTAWLTTESIERRVDAGDLVIMPHGTGHALRSEPHAPTVSLREWHEMHHGPNRIEAEADDGPLTRLICGTYVFTQSEPHPLLRQLPEVLCVPKSGPDGQTELTTTVLGIVREFDQRDLGMAGIIRRLLDVMFIQTLRHWAKTNTEQASWLEALKEPTIGRSLALLHAKPDYKWTLEGLARQVGVSRAVLSRSFREHLGEPPLQYLSRVRIDTAAALLQTSEVSLAEIAAQVGYESDSALSRAFKRARGISPRTYRLGSGI